MLLVSLIPQAISGKLPTRSRLRDGEESEIGGLTVRGNLVLAERSELSAFNHTRGTFDNVPHWFYLLGLLVP